MSNRDIYDNIYDSMKDLYGIDVSAGMSKTFWSWLRQKALSLLLMVSRITDKIIPVVREWQNRPLEDLYTIVYLDGMVFNVRQDGQVRKRLST